jgi:hypothetical protein
VRLIFVVVLLLGAGALTVRHAMGRRHSIAIPLLLVPGLVLGFFEYEDRLAVQKMSAVASILSGRAVHVNCQRAAGQLVDASADLGDVMVGSDGQVADFTTIKYEACKNLRAWLGSNKTDPTLDQVIAVHVLAHESEHLAGVLPEAQAECISVQRTAETARLLGATPAQADALAATYWEEVYPDMSADYRSDECKDGGAMDLHPDDTSWPSPPSG